MEKIRYNIRPEVIFLDAVGTLFGVKGSVGAVYSDMARRFGVEVSGEALDAAFLRSFKGAGAPAFAESDLAETQAKEFTWWFDVATQTFKHAGVLDQFHDFGAFFIELYAHFATAEPWVIYPDVRPALDRWKRMGFSLGLLSNFDTRLYAVLQAIELDHYFSSITISTEVGAAKPDPQIFAIALHKHGCPAHAAWHIGDSFSEDYQAALAVGMRGIWLRRP